MHQQKYPVSSEKMRQKKLLWVTLLNFAITLLQIAGGIVSNSLALLSDAMHNLGDTTAIFIAYIASKISNKKPDERRTFGYQRAEIIAALFNAVVLIGICIVLLYEAVQRILNPEPVAGKLMLMVAVFGLIANLVSVLLLKSERGYNLNARAAYLHLLGDTLSSVAVIAGGVAMLVWEIYWIDPFITVFISIFIIRHTWHIVEETVDILMQSAPKEIDLNAIKAAVESIPSVANMHHVHIWKLSDRSIHLEAHLSMHADLKLSEMMDQQLLVENMLHETFQIQHTTLQIGYDCCEGDQSFIRH